VTRKYHDKEWLREKYHGEGLQQSEIADICGVQQSTISDWMSRHGIETVDRSDRFDNVQAVSMDEEELEQRLHELYVEKEMTTYEVAEELGVAQSTVHSWTDRYGVPTRTATYNRPVQFFTDRRGYEYFRHDVGDKHAAVPVHKLVMVAEEGLDVVRGKVVHHRNGVPWDNRPSNLELLSRSEHAKEHHEQGDLDTAGLKEGWC